MLVRLERALGYALRRWTESGYTSELWDAVASAMVRRIVVLTGAPRWTVADGGYELVCSRDVPMGTMTSSTSTTTGTASGK